jgi:xanthine dehydrogenase accessory factor
MSGSVSGGCVEGAVVQEALEVLATSRPNRVEYGIADELAISVGLACGGNIEVMITPLRPAIQQAWQHAVKRRHALALVTVLSGEHLGAQALWTEEGWQLFNMPALLTSSVDNATKQLLREQQSGRLQLDTAAGPVELFVDLHLPPPRLIVVGAVHIAIPLVALAKTLGYHTIVVDARSAFATPERFPHADQLIIRWPADALAEVGIDAATYLVLLTHDEKIDNAALAYAVTTSARYIGALGSRKTHAQRLASLRELGIDPALLARIHAPIGLDLGGRQPEEIALAIMAEIVTVRNRQREPVAA